MVATKLSLIRWLHLRPGGKFLFISSISIAEGPLFLFVRRGVHSVSEMLWFHTPETWLLYSCPRLSFTWSCSTPSIDWWTAKTVRLASAIGKLFTRQYHTLKKKRESVLEVKFVSCLSRMTISQYILGAPPFSASLLDHSCWATHIRDTHRHMHTLGWNQNKKDAI